MPRARRPRRVGAAPSTGGHFLSTSAIVGRDPRLRRNLIVEGRITAEVPLYAHGVAIGREGRLRGDIHASTIRVEGEVVGDLYAQDQVRVCHLATVIGNITAPIVILEEGARFRGRVKMEEPVPFLPPGAFSGRLVISERLGGEQDAMSREERRSSIRVEQRLEIEFSSDCPPIHAFVEDLSDRGMYIDAAQAPPAGESLEFSLTLPEVEAPIRGSAEVVWSGPTGMGVEFTDLSDAARDRIHHFVSAVHFGQLPDLPPLS